MTIPHEFTAKPGFAPWNAYFQKYPLAAEVVQKARRADVVFLHSADYYEVEPVSNGERGGFARVASLANLFPEHALRTAGGDYFNSGSLSPIYRGYEMAEAQKIYGVTQGIPGNHDFDRGLNEAKKLVSKAGFACYLTNLLKPNGTPLIGNKRYDVVNVNGRRIGFMGLVEDWSRELERSKLGDHVLTDPGMAGALAANMLVKSGAEMVVALTHCYEPVDRKIAEMAKPDLILGGHFHGAQILQLGATTLIKSGSDFENLSVVLVNFDHNNKPRIEAYNLPVTPEIPDDPEMALYVNRLIKETRHLRVPIAELSHDLDGRKEVVRTRESSLGHLVADMIRETTGADVAILNGSGLRSERIHRSGPMTVLDVYDILSFDDEIVTLSVSGEALLAAFEGALNKTDDFPQVSGIAFSYVREASGRVVIVRESVRIDGEPWFPEKIYRVGCPSFLAKGQSGYKAFAKFSPQEALAEPVLLRNAFIAYLERRKIAGLQKETRLRLVSDS